MHINIFFSFELAQQSVLGLCSIFKFMIIKECSLSTDHYYKSIQSFDFSIFLISSIIILLAHTIGFLIQWIA